MARRARSPQPATPARRRRERHGRTLRSAVTGPHLPMLHTRMGDFEIAVADTAQYLQGLWPDELAQVRFEVAAFPHGASDASVERWRVLPRERRVILYRVPIERLSRLHRQDALHRRMLVESCVFRAVAELLGKDPWDLAPERFRHL